VVEEVSELANKDWGSVCDRCHGSGKTDFGLRCSYCNGFGRISIERGEPRTQITETETIREVRRQVTVDGKQVDLRNGRNHMILFPPISNLIDLAQVWLHQLETEDDRTVLRAVRMDLQRLIAYRGNELPPDLKRIILLTLKGELSDPLQVGKPPLPSPSTHFHEPKPYPQGD
jgi:hypothetical protein